MLPKPLRFLWGNLEKAELQKFGLLSLALMCTIGPYWMFRGIREAIFIDFVGIRWQPIGKLAAFVFIIPLILVYSKLIDYVKKEKLFYVIYPFYISTFLLIAFFVQYPQLSPSFSFVPGNITGWISYVIFESFGILAAALFWSFVASQTTTAEAKRGYGMILSVTQVGTIFGSYFVSQFSEILGLPLIIVFASVSVALVPFIIKSFMKNNAQEEVKIEEQKTGFFEGLRLLTKEPYLLGIFVISTGYEIIGVMLEYQMSVLASTVYPSKELFASFFAKYGMYANGLTLIFAIFGTSYFLQRFGLRICLLLFPIATGFIICGVRIFPVLNVMFFSMVILKGLSYALNIPAKEILYIPTTRDIKFKAKGWIDVSGIKLVKAAGSGINAAFSNLTALQTISYATPILLLIVSGWAFVARLVSVKNHDLVKEDKIIGQDP